MRLFAYDLKDNPRLVTDANGNATSFEYDVHGREVERSNAPGNTWRFAYDSRDNMEQTVDALRIGPAEQAGRSIRVNLTRGPFTPGARRR